MSGRETGISQIGQAKVAGMVPTVRDILEVLEKLAPSSQGWAVSIEMDGREEPPMKYE